MSEELREVYLREREKLVEILRLCKLDDVIPVVENELFKLYTIASNCLNSEKPFECFVDDNYVKESPLTTFVIKLASILYKRQFNEVNEFTQIHKSSPARLATKPISVAMTHLDDCTHRSLLSRAVMLKIP